VNRLCNNQLINHAVLLRVINNQAICRQQSISHLDHLTTQLLYFWVIKGELKVHEGADYCFLIGVYVSQSHFNHYYFVLNSMFDQLILLICKITLK